MMTFPTCAVESGTSGMADQYRSVTRELNVPIVQVCNACQSSYWPARLRCDCGAAKFAWRPAGERGRIVSSVRVDVADDEASRYGVPRRLRDHLPYTTVIVEPEDWPGTRMAMLLRTSVPSDDVSLRIEVHDGSFELIAGDVS